MFALEFKLCVYNIHASGTTAVVSLEQPMLAGCSGDPSLLERLQCFLDRARDEVEEKPQQLEELGEQEYLARSGKKSATVM